MERFFYLVLKSITNPISTMRTNLTNEDNSNKSETTEDSLYSFDLLFHSQDKTISHKQDNSKIIDLCHMIIW